MKVLTILGTRPEAIKLAPVLRELSQSDDCEVRACFTGQHREMVSSVLRLFGLNPEYDLDVMRHNQDLSELIANLLHGLRAVFDDFRPDVVLVQGDTSTAMAGALSGFLHKARVAHVEAGLRTGNILSPWPEEMNRRVISPLCRWHFAPTVSARLNLEREGIAPSEVFVTGNTVIDALLDVVLRLKTESEFSAPLHSRFAFLDPRRKLILVTSHRRESFGAPFEEICKAIRNLSARTDVEIVYPVHLNPNIRSTAARLLSDIENVRLIEPQDYLSFVYLMQRAHLVLTDSGGVQEEAPALGKPVLVLREVTERPEGVEAGNALLVGTNAQAIVRMANSIMDDDTLRESMTTRRSPYGDGQASKRIAAVLAGREMQEFKADLR